MIGLLEFFVLVCIFSYFIGKNRTSTMIDILTTRFHDAYSYLVSEDVSRQNDNNNDIMKEKTSINRFNNEHIKYNRSETTLKDAEQNGYEDSNDDDSLLTIDSLICRDCSKSTDRESQINPFDRARKPVDILKVTQHAPRTNKYDWGTYFPHIAQNLRVKKYKYKPIFESVFNHKRVQHEIERVAKDAVRESDVSFEMEDIYYEKMLDKSKKRAYKLLCDMRHTLSDGLLRLTSYVLYKLLPWFLSGVVAHPAQIEMLKVAQKKLPNTPLVFLPLHRSHLDYILVTFILLNNDIQCPQVCAGENLNIPVFGFLLRGLGAFYIRRKIDGDDGKKDYIYRGLLQTYMEESISAGHNIEFFIEGGRTRTGKPGLPKGGILSVIVDAFVDGLIDDALLVPVSVNYEKLVDGSFVREQLGIPKKKESFTKAIASIWKVLNRKYGLMRIDFNEPFSLRELVKSFKERKASVPRPVPSVRRLISKPSMTSVYGEMEFTDKHRALVDNIGRHVVYDSCTAMSIMSTNALSFLLLNKYRKGASLKDLVRSLDEIREQFEGKRDFGFDEPSENVIMTAVELLGTDMIERKVDVNGNIFIAPVLSIPNVVETFYYSQTFAPHIALDAAVLTGIAAELKENNCSSLTMNDIIDSTLLYCDVLRSEFIFHKPCQDINDQIQLAVERLCKLGSLTKLKGSDEYELNIKLSETLLSSMAALNITYWTTTECLLDVFEKGHILESDFIKLCINRITEKYNDGKITYGEAISTDSIRNCLKLLQKWSVVEVDVQSGKRIILLTSLYNSISSIEEVVEKIERNVIFK
ncbi:glycerol-3-phosphate acyltransferase 1, mitochondrial-like [Chironomus tepperi]|uniref:glycerol-3-phosphate acyltransferase 1, mitochondrial-like n=2 Tax=Chironomus tepperi TaxID=113505 RepID=UPI00391F8927